MPIYKTDKKKDGLQQYLVKVSSYKNGKNRQLVRTVYGKDEAKRVEAELRILVSRAVAKYKTDDFIEYYVREKTGKQSTKEKDLRILEQYVKGKFGRLDKISVRDVSEWRTEINALPLKSSTKRNIFRSLSTMLKFAVKRGVLVNNPCDTVEGFSPTSKALTANDYYSLEEWKIYENKAFERAQRKGNYDYYVFFCIAFYIGARKGEINAFNWTDYAHGRLNITRSINQKVKGVRYVETAPKTTASIRSVCVPAPLALILDAHKARQQKDKRWTPNRRICGDTDILPDTNIENENKAIAAEAGLKHIRIHDFRHSHASVLANNGINIMEIARRLGHSDVKLTWNRYSHLYPAEEDRATKLLDEIELQHN